jgi:LPS-assembly lipoprotein
MERTYISTADEFSPFYRQLRRSLQAAGVDVTDSPDDATATLTILSDDTGQRVLSVSARNVPTEFEVFYTIRYSITNGEGSLLKPQELTLTRDYTWDETLVLGKAKEEQLMRDAIVDDLVRIVMKQISAI